MKIVKDNEHLFIDANVESQLFEKGIDSKGRKLKPPYTSFTKMIKRQKGQPIDKVTLRDTGEFHDSFFLKTDKFPVEFLAQDFKEQKLVEKYGIDIFGVTVSNRKEISQNYIKPQLVTFLKQNM